jgi:hypothetical protein
MRLLRVLCCTLLFSVFTVGQNPATPATTPPADGSPQANQPPQNPLQEPQKPSEAEANRPKPASFDTGNTGGSAEDQSLGELHLMSRYTQLNGDLTRSFREAGSNNLAEFNYFFDHGLGGGTRRFQLLSMYRSTDDRSLDPERNSLQKAFLRFYGPRDEYILGDALVNYSRLTFNQNVKGLSMAWKLGQSWKASVFGGIFIDRYGSLYKPFSALPGRPYLSRVSGARLEYKFARDSAFGFNFSSSDDKESSLPYASVSTAPMPVSNRVGSVDMKLQGLGIRLDGEYAYSFTNFDVRSDTATACPGYNPLDSSTWPDSRSPQPCLGNQGDWGGRMEGSWRYRRLSVRGSYMRFQPNFASFNARQIADLEDIVLRTSVDVTDWLMVDGTMRRSANDLRKQLPYETKLLGPEARLVLHQLPFYKRATWEVGYRYREVTATDITKVNRYVRNPYTELTLPFGGTFFTVGFEQRRAVDLVDPTQSTNANRPYVSLRGVYDVGGWHFNPQFRYELERQKWPAYGAQVMHLDSNRLGSAALYIEAPKWFIMEGAFRDASATILGPSGFSRPSYRAALTYKFLNDENTTFVFSFERNNNFYMVPVGSLTPPANFDERVMGVTFVYKFGRRGSR